MQGGKCVALWMILSLAAALHCRRAEAVNPETLLMPGKLSSAHAKYEEQCSKCHDRADRDHQTRLCLNCHQEIDTDIRTHRGFHGKASALAASQCRACHSEHQGRDGDIVKLIPEQFNHEQSEFPLRGAHTNAVCAGCHASGKKYRQAPPTCVGCHQKDEPHEGKLGRECGTCHTDTNWRAVTYDHDKTAFPLKDKHAELACVACHFGNRYAGTPKQCVSCHAPEDVHRGQRGPKCTECHSTAGWKTAKFDHEKETGFALEGVHAHLDCQDCHRSGNLHDKLPKDCHGCHSGQDSHATRLGEDCGKCHGNDKWKPSQFDHARDAHWPLTGHHAQVGCHGCHTAAVLTQKLPENCSGCHKASDVHAGTLGLKCEQCHTTQDWRATVGFDHDLTPFPLVGLHVAVPCEQCHLTRQYRDAGKGCIDCHKSDDVHKGSLGSDCARCHSPNGWRVWQFDHGKETGFALTGAHQKLACAGCHKQPADVVKLSPNCLSCHEQDDVHLGQYGRQCQRCHSTVTFKGARLQ